MDSLDIDAIHIELNSYIESINPGYQVPGNILTLGAKLTPMDPNYIPGHDDY